MCLHVTCHQHKTLPLALSGAGELIDPQAASARHRSAAAHNHLGRCAGALPSSASDAGSCPVEALWAYAGAGQLSTVLAVG